MTAERVALPPAARLSISYTLALVTGFFQASFWGLPGMGEMPLAGPLAAITFIAWLASICWVFLSSMKSGWLSLFGIVPAFAFVWIVALLMWACASGRGCI